MAITSEIIGKLGGADVEVEPVSGTASGRGGSRVTLHTVQVPDGETWLVAAIGTITTAGTILADCAQLGVGDRKVTFMGKGGASAIVTGTTQVTLNRQASYGSDSFTGHVYTVKL